MTSSYLFSEEAIELFRRLKRLFIRTSAAFLIVFLCSCSVRAADVTSKALTEKFQEAETAGKTASRYSDITDAVENGEDDIRTLLSEILSAAAAWPADFGMPSEISSLTARGPYQLCSITAEECELEKLIYLVLSGDTVVGAVTVRLEKGAVGGCYSSDFSGALNSAEDTDNFIYVETTGGFCAVDRSGEIIMLRGSADVFSGLGTYDLPDPGELSVGEYDFDITPGTGISVTVPAVSQYEDGDCYLCFLGCITALVKAREPETYHGLTVSGACDMIYDRLKPLGGKYKQYYMDCAENTRYVIENAFLDQGALYHRCADFNGSMTVSEYIDAVDRKEIVICVGFGKNALHSVVMCGCTERPSGGIFVTIMDPYTGSHHLVSWSEGRFGFDFSSSAVYMGEYVVSYY